MEIEQFIPGLICIIAALIIMIRLMHYAHFYAPSYFFWIGAIITLTGIVSLIRPLEYLFIADRTVALYVLAGGMLTAIAALLYPVRLMHSPTRDQKIDALLPDYSFNELHTVRIKASPEKIKDTLRVTGVKDIAAAHILMKIRGIADDNVDMSDTASKSEPDTNTFSTPDFNFLVVDPTEFITVMIIKAAMVTNRSHKPAPPDIASLEQFIAFDNPGYVKVAMNFRFIDNGSEETILNRNPSPWNRA